MVPRRKPLPIYFHSQKGSGRYLYVDSGQWLQTIPVDSLPLRQALFDIETEQLYNALKFFNTYFLIPSHNLNFASVNLHPSLMSLPAGRLNKSSKKNLQCLKTLGKCQKMS